MRSKFNIGLTAKAVSLVALLGLVTAMPVSAEVSHFLRGISVFDNFNYLLHRPAPYAYWWTENMGVQADGSAGVIRETNCALQTCVRQVSEGGDNFVRLEDFPVDTHTVYVNANLSEDVDGADTDPVYMGQTYPGPWTPTIGHPVTVEARARFSANYNQNGSGGAQGTTGIWLWNNPFSQQAADPESIYSGIGFSWTYDGTFLIHGLSATVTESAFPISYTPILMPVNMQDWNTFKFVWSQGILGFQTVTYYINGTVVATSTLLPTQAMQNLGLEIWNDNQQFTLQGLNRVPITQHQYLDVDYVSIKKTL